jgi:RNA polymerase primary sigma factor
MTPLTLPRTRLANELQTSLTAKWWRATAVLSERLGRAPSAEEIGKALGLSRKRLGVVTQAIEVQKMMKSPQSSNEEQADLIQATDKRSRKLFDQLVDADDLDWIIRGLDHLDERMATVIRMRFGLGQHAPMTLQQVGEHFGLTRERVRQLEAEALQELREVA